MPAPSAPGRKALERLHVHEVLVPTGRTLVHQQILATQYRTLRPPKSTKVELLSRDRTYRDDGARKAMLTVFDLLGDDHLLTKEYRKKLMSALY